MEVTRKGFISSLGATVAAAALPFDPVSVPLVARREIGGAKSFAPLVGSEFYALTPGGRRASMVLREVIELPGDRHTEQFSLVFDPGRGTTIPPGTYAVDHPSLGSLYLFLTAGGIGRTAESAPVRADFSLLRV